MTNNTGRGLELFLLNVIFFTPPLIYSNDLQARIVKTKRITKTMKF